MEIFLFRKRWPEKKRYITGLIESALYYVLLYIHDL